MRKGQLRIRERERENWPIVSLIIGQLLYVEQHARAFYIFIHTHTKRCEIIKQTNKQKSVRIVPLLSRWMRRNP
jgi:hypothetical protein